MDEAPDSAWPITGRTVPDSTMGVQWHNGGATVDDKSTDDGNTRMMEGVLKGKLAASQFTGQIGDCRQRSHMCV
jgi:hypothetical protein